MKKDPKFAKDSFVQNLKTIIKQDSKGYYSVQIGAYKVKANAEKTKKDLETKLNIKSIIKFY